MLYSLQADLLLMNIMTPIISIRLYNLNYYILQHCIIKEENTRKGVRVVASSKYSTGLSEMICRRQGLLFKMTFVNVTKFRMHGSGDIGKMFRQLFINKGQRNPQKSFQLLSEALKSKYSHLQHCLKRAIYYKTWDVSDATFS